MESLIRDMSTPMFVGVLCVLFAIAGALFASAWQSRRRALVMEQTPTSLVAFAQDGHREFEGVVEAIDGQTLSAPLTGAACCWYRARVERWRTSRDQGSHWETVDDTTSSAPFFMRDGSGVCAVYPAGAEVTATDRSVWTGATRRPTDRNPERIPHGLWPSSTVQVSGGGGADYRYTEERIYAGNPLYVIGEFTSGRFSGRAQASIDDREDEQVPDDAVDDADLDDDAGASEDEGDEVVAPIDDSAIADQLIDRAWATTRASVAKGAGRQPFIVSTAPQAAHVVMTKMGAQAASSIAWAPLLLAALLLWTRFK